MRIIIILIILMASTFSAMAETSSIPDNTSKILKKHNPKVKWESIIGQDDVNCDGKKDYIVVGKVNNRLHVAVVLGPLSDKSKVSSINIGLGSERYQDSLGEKDPSIRIVSLDYDPKEVTGFPAEGFKRSKTCKGIEIGGEETDEFNVYWNHKKNILDWWRL